MPATTAQMDAKRSADAPAKRGRKTRLRTLADLDRRTKTARAAFELRDRIVADLGGVDHLSAMHMELVDNVCVMGAMLRDMAAGYLTGGPIDLAEFTTLANAQRRLLADLGLERRAKDVTPDLRDYMAQKAREKAEVAA